MYKKICVVLSIVLIIVIAYFAYYVGNLNEQKEILEQELVKIKSGIKSADCSNQQRGWKFSNKDLEREVNTLIYMIKPYYCDKLKLFIQEAKNNVSLSAETSFNINELKSGIDQMGFDSLLKTQIHKVFDLIYSESINNNRININKVNTLLDELYANLCGDVLPSDPRANLNVFMNNIKNQYGSKPIYDTKVQTSNTVTQKVESNITESFRNHKRYDF